MKKPKQWLMLIVTTLILAACAEDEKQGAQETKNIAITTVKVATEVPYPPFEYEENGTLTGFDMDVIRAIGEELDWEVVIQKETFDEVFNKVDDGSYDIGISAITASDERKKAYGFSQPYFTAYQLILVHKDFKVASLHELKGKTIAVQKSTTGHEFVKQKVGENTSNLLAFADMEQAIQSFIQGEADAMVGDNAFILDYLKRNNVTDYALIKDPNAPLEYFGIMTKKGNEPLLQEINRGITIIQENGVYDAIYERYFGN